MVTAEIARQLLNYNPDTGKLTWKERDISWFSQKGKRTAEHAMRNWNSRCAGKLAFECLCQTSYLQGTLLGQRLLAHRLIWLMQFGEWPKNIDHINGNRSDNRIANLRDVDISVNNKNLGLRKTNKSGFSGVCWDRFRGMWAAEIKDNGRKVYLGRFVNIEDAVAARKEAEIHFGYHINHGSVRE